MESTKNGKGKKKRKKSWRRHIGIKRGKKQMGESIRGEDLNTGGKKKKS